MRLIGETCPTSVLFCGCDQWSPEHHNKDLKRLQSRSEIPNNIHLDYIAFLRHDYIVHPEMIESVVRFCVDRINSVKGSSKVNIRSRL